jgi:acid phosphatase type 7
VIFIRRIICLVIVLLFCRNSESQAAVRGPYLQSAGATRITVCWRTESPSRGVVRYGTTPGELTHQARSSSVAKEQFVHLTGLKPDTTYFYSIGTAQAVESEGPDYHFKTSPSGSGRSSRMWVLGDSGAIGAEAVRDGFMAFNGSTPIDAILMLGDNAYENGTDSEYQVAVFDRFAQQLRKSVLWPTIGNHDTAQSRDPSKPIAYTDIFSLPTRGECGGLPSRSERFYSFDFGDAHFVCLDSMTSPLGLDDAMATWLRADLAATRKKWKVAFWHHAPYSKTSHDSDWDAAMVAMRQRIVPILEKGGVDLVLCGHSHAYERSKLINGHYGVSGSFASDFVFNVSPSLYEKPVKYGPHQGTAYVVVGTSGRVSLPDVVGSPHPAMQTSFRRLGSLALDIEEDRLEVKFISVSGSVDDSFAITRTELPEPTIVISTGDTVDGVGTLRSFGVPSLNDAGKIAFLARAATQSGSVSALFSGDDLIATTGGSSFAKLSDPMLNNVGDVAFFGTEMGRRQEGLYVSSGGSIRTIARVGDVAPGTSSASWNGITGALLCDDWCAFTASLSGVSASLNSGLWFATPLSTTLAVRNGDRMTLNGRERIIRSFEALTSPAGGLAQGYTPAAEELVVRVTFTDDTQAMLSFSPTGYSWIATSGDLAPGPIFGARFASFSVPCGNVFHAKLQPGFGSVTLANDTAAFVWDGSLRRLFTESQPLRSAERIATFRGHATSAVEGSVAVATVVGNNVTAERNTGIIKSDDAEFPYFIARESQKVPRLGARFASFHSLSISDSPQSSIGFVASLKSDSLGVSAANNSAAFGVNSEGKAVPFLAKGQKINGKTVAGFSVFATAHKSRAQARSINSARQVVARVLFTDRSQSIVVVTLQ